MKTRDSGRNAHAGFTLIELLVVIAIITLLATVTVTSLMAAQAKARDARRIDDVGQLKKALALYESGVGSYPTAVATTTLTATSTVGATLIAAEAMPSMPKDPNDPTFTYGYVSDSTGSTYNISFCLETNSIKNYSQGCGNIVSP